MKVSWKRPRTDGNVLLIVLAIVALLGIGLGSYLMLVSSQSRLVAQSQSWNTALVHAEGGVEEAMEQVNVVFGTNYSASAQTNWGGPIDGVYGPRTNALTGGWYSAIIAAGSQGPTIISTGYATVAINPEPVKRTIQVKTAPAYAFGNAIAALNVTMNGNNVMVDSYDSNDPLHCDAYGRYDATRRKAGGDVSCTSGFLNVGNADIFGHVRTAPYGSASTGPNGRVGDLPENWNGTGIQPGWYLNDYNASFPDVTPPYTSATQVSRNGTGTNTFVLSGGDYLVDGDFAIANRETLLITGGNVRLYVTGNFTMQGQNGAYISIAGGATLQLFVGTATGPAVSATFMSINNQGNSYNFQYYGLPSNISATWGGNATWLGTVYAPEALFTLNGGGGGGNASDFQGACVVNAVTMNGHFNFHYDEDLKRHGPVIGFTVSSWKEL